ncbi:MAG: MmgE/PrpD family protein [Candidatus Tectomicrobia bacterium]|nr:MmgE/PrpD family protein [Candidatus Tectomicrobia bacterium]
MDAIAVFAQHIAETDYDDLPAELHAVGKRFALDTLGVALAGSSAPGCETVAELVRGWGGAPESTLFLHGAKVPAHHALLANTMMSRARDFCDTHDDIGLHINTSVLPTALAAAEQRGGASGREVLAAVALAGDMMCRMGLAVGTDRPIHFSAATIYGAFGSTAAAGKVLRLDVEQLIHAFGIMLSQTAGNIQCLMDGALSLRMQQAFGAQAGMLSARLAQRGITGARRVLEGEHGFYALYEEGNYRRERLLDGLGERYEGMNLSMKPYPCCRCNHAGIEAVLTLARRHRISADQVEKVVVSLPPFGYTSVGRPFFAGATVVDAQFNMQYTTATALLKGDVFIDDFTPEAVKEPQRLELARRVTVLRNDAIRAMKALAPVRVEITTKSGATHAHTVPAALGHPSHPMTDTEVREKFRKCAGHAVKTLPAERLAALVSACERLDELDDVRELTALLA